DSTSCSRLALCIETPEILEHEATLFGAQAAQLAPVEHTELPGRLAGGAAVGRPEGGGGGSGFAFALPGVFALLAFERASGVEHSPEQPLLPFGYARIQRAHFERVRKLARLTSHLIRATGGIAIANILQVACKLPLLLRKASCGVARSLPCLAPGSGKQSASLRIQRSLPLRKFSQLLDHLAEARCAAGGVDAFAVAHERCRSLR